jgi:hypothetical protein
MLMPYCIIRSQAPVKIGHLRDRVGEKGDLGKLHKNDLLFSCLCCRAKARLQTL